MFESLSALKGTLAKRRKALEEGINLRDIITTQDLCITPKPFPHIVVDDFFKKDLYADIERFFTTKAQQGLSEERSPTRFQPFLDLNEEGFEYDGYVYAPYAEEDPALKPLFSLSWNLFFSDLFSQPTDWATALALHHHPPGDRTGFVHNDYAAKRFSVRNMLASGVIYRELSDARPPDPSIFSTMRAIALILYLGGDAAMGGGTGLYSAAGLAPELIVEPRANRLLAFQVTPQSFHAFQANSAERNSLIQWFHVNKNWCQKRYGYV